MRRGASEAERLAATRALLEFERTITRLRRRGAPRAACSRCGAINPLVFNRECRPPICYRCRVQRESEQHSLIGDHLKPRVPIDPNAHKILDEVQRIMRAVLVPGVRVEVACNIAAYIAVRLCMLGSLETW